MARILNEVETIPASVRKYKRFSSAWAEVAKHVFIWITFLAILYPLVIMVQMSFKDIEQIMYHFFSWTGTYHFENYSRAWSQVSPLILNSLIMGVGTAVLSILMSSIAGYAFAKLQFPGKEVVYWIIFAKMLLPGVINLVPAFVLAWRLNLLDTHWAVILFGAAANMPFWCFVMRTFVAQQPTELFESSRIDGAGEFRIFWNIALPLLKPMVTLCGMQVFLGVWNDYIWPLVTIQTFEKRPLTVGLAYLTTGFPGDYGPQMAGYVIASIPLLIMFILGMRQFVAGLTGGSIKL